MKRLMGWAARLYPAAWRARYGAEFEALLEDAPLKSHDLWDVVRGACIMRITRVNFATIVLCGVLAGGLIAGVWSVGRLSGYISTGVLRAQASDTKYLTTVIAVQQAVHQTMSRGSLSEIMTRPSLNLYHTERTSMPLEDVIEKMRRDVRIQLWGIRKRRLGVSVSFHYPDAEIARRTTGALIERLRESLAATATVQVIDAASPAVAPAGTERWGMIAWGMIAGLVVGIGCGVLWTIVRNRQRWSLPRLGAFAAAGTVLGVTVALLLPDVYLSTAVVQSRAPVDQAALERTILNEESLSGIIRREGLYPRQVARHAARRGRAAHETGRAGASVRTGHSRWIPSRLRDFVSRSRPAPGPAGNARSDRRLAFREPRSGGGNVVEVLDPPSDPTAPTSPNRVTIAGLGTIAGLLFGLGATRFRRMVEAHV